MWKVEFSEDSDNYLDRLDNDISERIENALKRLENNPIPSDSKFIERINGDKVFRYRIGKYRALYKIKENERVVFIIKIDKRSKVYE